jgi:hypothetical protein
MKFTKDDMIGIGVTMLLGALLGLMLGYGALYTGV